MRLFVAIDLPDQVRSALRGLQEDLRRELGRLRWVRPEGIHLTLRFLGEVAEADLARVRAALARSVPGCVPPFSIGLAGVGSFPTKGRPRVIWVGIQPAGSEPGGGTALSALQSRVEAAMQEAGRPPEERPFRPHLTLARVGEGPPPRLLPEVLTRHAPDHLGEFRVSKVCLFRSTLKPSGAEYARLEEYAL